jgi:hypothetical protein
MKMRLLLPAVAAALLLAGQPARAQSRAGGGCLARWDWAPGATHAMGSTRAGTPCQLGFGERGGIIQALRITVRPSHGILGKATPEGGRYYLAYVPAARFVGHDRFELYIQVIPPRGGISMTTRFIVDMDVTP